MLHIPNTNAHIQLNPNDARPEAVRSKDVLIAYKKIDLKTGENIVIFSRTTPEKIAQFKSLKPLMLAARNEIDALTKKAYFIKHGKDIPSEKLKNIKHLLSISTENNFYLNDKQLEKSLANNNMQHEKNKSNNDRNFSAKNILSNSEAKSVKISKKALSAEAFESTFKNTNK